MIYTASCGSSSPRVWIQVVLVAELKHHQRQPQLVLARDRGDELTELAHLPAVERAVLPQHVRHRRELLLRGRAATAATEAGHVAAGRVHGGGHGAALCTPCPLRLALQLLPLKVGSEHRIALWARMQLCLLELLTHPV